MGLSKWIIKNGMGGVGWMTKFWIKQYLNYPQYLEEEDKLLSLIKNFQNTQRASNNLIRVTDSNKLLQYSENCLATLIFCLMCDTNGFEKTISVSEATFNDVIKVIYEIVNELAPNSINCMPENFRYNCITYVT